MRPALLLLLAVVVVLAIGKHQDDSAARPAQHVTVACTARPADPDGHGPLSYLPDKDDQEAAIVDTTLGYDAAGQARCGYHLTEAP